MTIPDDRGAAALAAEEAGRPVSGHERQVWDAAYSAGMRRGYRVLRDALRPISPEPRP